MLNDHHVQLVGLHLDKNKDGGLFGRDSFTIEGKFEESGGGHHPPNSNKNNKNNNNNNHTNVINQLQTENAPFVVSYSSNDEDNDNSSSLPAVKLSPWHFLFSTPPSSISVPVEECGILMINGKFVFSSGSDLPTIPAFKKLHQDFWRTILETDYRIFGGDLTLKDKNGKNIQQQQQQPEFHHPMPALNLDLIVTLCNRKMTSILNEYGKMVSYYEDNDEGNDNNDDE